MKVMNFTTSRPATMTLNKDGSIADVSMRLEDFKAEHTAVHIAGLKEAAARVKEDAEEATGAVRIALEDAWSGIQSLIADWEAQ